MVFQNELSIFLSSGSCKVSLHCVITNVYEDIGTPNVLGRSLELNSKLENIQPVLNLHVCIKKICGPSVYYNIHME